MTAPIEASHWNVGAGYKTGKMYFSVGYLLSTLEFGPFEESTYGHFSLTANYALAPGLSVYAEFGMVSDELLGGSLLTEADASSLTNDSTFAILGASITF